MFNELENKYEGMVDGEYEGWFIVLYQDETKARVMWSCMKDEENVVSVVVEDWEKFADGTWGAFNLVSDDLQYKYTKENDVYYYTKLKKVYCELVKEEN